MWELQSYCLHATFEVDVVSTSRLRSESRIEVLLLSNVSDITCRCKKRLLEPYTMRRCITVEGSGSMCGCKRNALSLPCSLLVPLICLANLHIIRDYQCVSGLADMSKQLRSRCKLFMAYLALLSKPSTHEIANQRSRERRVEEKHNTPLVSTPSLPPLWPSSPLFFLQEFRFGRGFFCWHNRYLWRR